MPGWHEATKELLEQGKVRVVGIIQEQHPERCRLFMQWQQMGWPILVDSLDLLDVAAVPLTFFIDERGIVRERPSRRTPPREALEAFLAEPPLEPVDGPEGSTGSTGAIAADARPIVDLVALKRVADAPAATAADRRRYAEALVLWGGDVGVDEAIERFDRIVESDPGDGHAWFRKGVAHRMRYDGERGGPEDFRAAVAGWSRALAIDPNQYIWRRRIQQYGPRLDKPYPFYDWVATARAELTARGETPLPLRVEPSGAELTHPSKEFAVLADDDPSAAIEPDPDVKIHRDPGRFVRSFGQSVPGSIAPGESTRVHLEFRPEIERDAHWNNEARGLRVWIDPPQGWRVDRRSVELANPDRATSEEHRRVEFEVRAPENASGTTRIAAYALYYVCEGVAGQCLYRRQDLAVEVTVDRGGDGP